jgi:hypothetical protein
MNSKEPLLYYLITTSFFNERKYWITFYPNGSVLIKFPGGGCYIKNFEESILIWEQNFSEVQHDEMV